MDNTSDSSPPALSIRGEFTIFTAMASKELLLNALTHSVATDIDIDLSEVTEIDTAGLQLMIMAKREASSQGKNVRFRRHSDAVLDLIDLCDLTGFFGDPVLIRAKQ